MKKNIYYIYGYYNGFYIINIYIKGNIILSYMIWPR